MPECACRNTNSCGTYSSSSSSSSHQSHQTMPQPPRSKAGTPTENEPLLPRYEQVEGRGVSALEQEQYGTAPTPIFKEKKSRSWAVPKILALLVFIFASSALFIRFMDFNLLQKEMEHVPKVNIRDVTLEGFTDEGMNVRISGNTHIDYNRIESKGRRGVVKTVAKVLQSLTLSSSKLEIFFLQDVDDYARTVDATMPNLKVNIDQDAVTDFNFITTLSNFGSVHLMGTILERILASDPLTFRGVSNIGIRKGILYFGKVPIEIEQTVNSGQDEMDIKIGDIKLLSGTGKAVGISTVISSMYDLPVGADIPSLNWDVLIDGCDNRSSSSSHSGGLLVTRGHSGALHLEPHKRANVSVSAVLDSLPDELTQACGTAQKSPLDVFVSNYLDGQENVVTIKSSQSNGEKLPLWMGPLLEQLKLQISFSGKNSQEDLIKDLQFDNFRLQFPSGDGMTRVSAQITVVVEPPSSIDIDQDLPINVSDARGVADLYSDSTRFAQVMIEEWVPCTTTPKDGGYVIQFDLDAVPVNVTNQTVFNRVVRDVLFKGASPIRVNSLVDAKLKLPLGDFVLSEIPASGDTELKT